MSGPEVARRVIAIVDLATVSAAGYSALATVERALDAGARVLLLRGKDATSPMIAEAALLAIASAIEAAGGTLLLHGDTPWCPPLPDVFGYHYGAGRLWSDLAPPLGPVARRSADHTAQVHDAEVFVARGNQEATRPPLFGFSCHSSEELQRAALGGAAWATLSPFSLTASKPGYGPALGVEGLRKLALGCTVPIFALAGVSALNVRGIGEAGAAGVALMGMLSASDLRTPLQALFQRLEEELWLVHPPW